MIRKNYSKEEFELWKKVARNIGVDIEYLSQIQRKKIAFNGVNFNIIYSPKRQDRPDQRNPISTKIPLCNMCKELTRWNKLGDNMLDSRSYNGYLACPNLFPIDIGHVVLIQDDHDKTVVTNKDLEAMLSFSKERGYLVWHNMQGAASTIPHDHFQAIPFNSPVEDMQLESYDSKKAHIKDYPGLNFVYTENNTKDANSTIHELYHNNIPFTINCIGENIFLFPFRVPQGKGGIGGFETSLNFVAKTQEEFTEVTGNQLEQRLRDTLYMVSNDYIIAYREVCNHSSSNRVKLIGSSNDYPSSESIVRNLVYKYPCSYPYHNETHCFDCVGFSLCDYQVLPFTKEKAEEFGLDLKKESKKLN